MVSNPTSSAADNDVVESRRRGSTAEVVPRTFGAPGPIGDRSENDSHAGARSEVWSFPVAAATSARKRAFDVVLTLLGAVVWLPVIAVGALMIRLLDGAPAFYASKRRVHRDQSSRVLKLRTMVRDAERTGNRKTLPVEGRRFLNIPIDSPLYTRVGRVIERFHLTELPQFVNVVMGQMSVVGNRPLPEDVIASLREEYPDVETRFLIRCGMTGPVQLIGRDALSDRDRLTLECEYCQSVLSGYSVRLDLMLFSLTLLIGLRIVRGRSFDEVRDLIRRYRSAEPLPGKVD